MLARVETTLLNPVYRGKVMAGLSDMARAGAFEAGQKVLFVHIAGLPALHAYEAVALGDA